jgi:D-Tyr-tRNAtyr deacylase
MAPGPARELFDSIVERTQTQYDKEQSAGAVVTGFFGEHMHVELVNDGPVTLELESK